MRGEKSLQWTSTNTECQSHLKYHVIWHAYICQINSKHFVTAFLHVRKIVSYGLTVCLTKLTCFRQRRTCIWVWNFQDSHICACSLFVYKYNWCSESSSERLISFWFGNWKFRKFCDIISKTAIIVLRRCQKTVKLANV